jgi:gamma-glutamyltranspeptidase/glutathione hydrolase
MQGAIAAGHPLTADAGARVLENGGGAIDACIAAAFTAFVTEGPLTGPAGGGFLLLHHGGETTALDCFFAQPSRPLGELEEVVIDFVDAGTQVFRVGLGSIAVPGLVAGLAEVHRRHGRMPWAELVEPAIELARTAVAVGEPQAFLHDILTVILQREEGGRRIYGDAARVVAVDFVPTLELVAERGAGAVRELLPELADDLAAYEPRDLEPLRLAFRGREVATMPAPSRGGSVIEHTLTRLEAGDDVATALAAGYGAIAPGRLTGTTHISVVDAAGDAVGLSSTLGSGSGVFRGGTQMNNMLGEIDVIGRDPRPPGARLPSMMAPTLVLEDGRPRLVVGSAGSTRLAGAIAQVIAGVVADGLGVAEAIARPRAHVEQGVLQLEGGWVGEPPGEWEIVRWSGRNLYFGGTSAVELRPDGSLAAAGDPRRGGHGIVVQ